MKNYAKKEVINSLAEKTGLTKKNSEEFLEAFVELIEDVVKAHDKLSLTGFGTIEVVETSARKGRNPKTGEDVDVPASYKATFKLSPKLKKTAKQ